MRVSQPLATAATVGVGFLAIMTLIPSIRFFQVELPFFSKPKKNPPATQNSSTEQTQQVTFTKRKVISKKPITRNKTNTTDEKPVESTSQVATNLATERALTPTPVVKRAENEVELQQRIHSEEYSLEKEIAQATTHIRDDLTDFDQSIAEADFEAINSSQSVSSDAATPSFQEGSSKNELKDIELEGTKPEIDASQVVSTITALQNKYESLTNAHEIMKGQNAKYQLDLKRKDAMVRKSEAEKIQALKIKDQAVRLATMERKRRKLTELKARKIIMKLKLNAQRLESDIADS